MIKVSFNPERLPRQYFIVKVSYVDPVTNETVIGINTLVESRLCEEQVATILRAYCKDSYKLTIAPLEQGIKRMPNGYYESFALETVASDINRLRFVKQETIEVPKVVYIQKTVTTEL